MELSTERHIMRRLRSLKAIRAPMESVWEELSSNILSYRGIFGTNSKKRFRDIDTDVINNTASISSVVLSSGLMGGVSSPSKPWINFVVSNTRAMESTNVRIFVDGVKKIVSRVMSKSNIYNSIHTSYSELGVFATGAIGIYEDYENVIRTECYTIGTYYIDINSVGIVDTFYREISMTGQDIVDKFGIEALPDSIKADNEHDMYDVEYNIIHAIEPNKKFDKKSKRSSHKPFSSTYVYYQINSTNVGDTNNGYKGERVISTSGFDEFPIMIARWDVIPGDVYGGSCPGMRSIGDVKMLQEIENLYFRALEKEVDPPTVSGPTEGAIPEDGLQPGQHIEVATPADAIMHSIQNVQLDKAGIKGDKLEIQNRIKKAFYEDLFLQMLSSDRREMTASEVAERANEALITLGPVLTRLHNELLDPLTDRVYNIVKRAGLLPETPPELAEFKNAELDVEYISSLALAQKADVSHTIERFASFVAGISQTFPNARHKFNEFEAINEISNSLGVPPKITNSDQVAGDAAQQEAEQQQQQQQQQMLMEAAKVAPGMMGAAEDMAQAEQIEQ